MSIEGLIERTVNDRAAETAGLVRAEPRTVGQYYLGGEPPADHQCRPSCYRAYSWGISLGCDYGHSAGAWVDAANPPGSFGGSAFAASLNGLPAGAPFVKSSRQRS